MSDELLDLENDDPTEPSEPITPKNTGKPKSASKVQSIEDEPDVDFGGDAKDDIDIAAVLRGEKSVKSKPATSAPKVGVKPTAEVEDESGAEPTGEAEPGATSEPAKEPDKPAVDIEAEIEKRLTARMAEKEAERTRQEQERIQKTIDAIVAKERKRQDTDSRKLRDLLAKTGKSYDELAEIHATREVERLQNEEGLTEAAARRLVEADQKARLLESQEADRVREHEEQTKATAYRMEKADFMADAKQPDIFKKALQKYGPEVDAFSDYGKGVLFDVALKYVAGQHLNDIVADLQKDSDAKLAAKSAEADAREKAAEQRAIRNIGQRAKAAPETSTSGTAQKAPLPSGTAELALAMGLKPSAIAKTMASKKRR